MLKVSYKALVALGLSAVLVACANTGSNSAPYKINNADLSCENVNAIIAYTAEQKAAGVNGMNTYLSIVGEKAPIAAKMMAGQIVDVLYRTDLTEEELTNVRNEINQFCAENGAKEFFSSFNYACDDMTSFTAGIMEFRDQQTYTPQQLIDDVNSNLKADSIEAKAFLTQLALHVNNIYDNPKKTLEQYNNEVQAQCYITPVEASK